MCENYVHATLHTAHMHNLSQFCTHASFVFILLAVLCLFLLLALFCILLVFPRSCNMIYELVHRL